MRPANPGASDRRERRARPRRPRDERRAVERQLIRDRSGAVRRSKCAVSSADCFRGHPVEERGRLRLDVPPALRGLRHVIEQPATARRIGAAGQQSSEVVVRPVVRHNVRVSVGADRSAPGLRGPRARALQAVDTGSRGPAVVGGRRGGSICSVTTSGSLHRRGTNSRGEPIRWLQTERGDLAPQDSRAVGSRPSGGLQPAHPPAS